MNRVPPTPSRIGLDLTRVALSVMVPIWALVMLVVTAIVILVDSIGTVSDSIIDFASMPSRYWVLAAGLVMTATCFGPHVAHGVTRRAFTTAVLVAGTAIVTTLGVMMSTGFLVEGLVYDANGWEQSFSNRHLFDTSDLFGLVLVETILVYAAHFAAGWAMAGLFLRLRWIPAVIGSVGAYSLAAATELMLGAGWPGAVTRTVMDRYIEPAIGVPVAVALVLVAVVVARWTMLAAPVSRRPQ